MVHQLRDLPRVDALLARPELASADRGQAREAVRNALDAARQTLLRGGEVDVDALLAGVVAELARSRRPSLRPVINATGVVLHTNLGRAPWDPSVIAAAMEAAGRYVALEVDLDTGLRGGRGAGVASIVRRWLGAEDALVVNNGAAALLLTLTALAAGREVIVSRGELVEIGGGFRVPEIVAACGARLVEVGTTNRTRLDDYARAIGPETAALLAVHPSNFRMTGFVRGVPFDALAALARERGLASVWDIGSGQIDPGGDEPSLREAIGAGADVVVCSGDKLLGGPQAGLCVGRSEPLAALARHPLMRALRVDKVTLTAVEATLQRWVSGEPPPVARMLTTPLDVLQARAVTLARRLADRGVAVDVVPVEGAVGGGSRAGEVLTGWGVAVAVPELQRVQAELRRGEPAVLTRVAAERLVIDPRTVLPGEDDALVDAVCREALAAIARHERAGAR